MSKQAPHCTRAFYDEVVAPLKARAEAAESDRDGLRAELNRLAALLREAESPRNGKAA